VATNDLNLGHLAEEFAKLLVDVPTAAVSDATIDLEEGERREVTILFLDIVGYTQLAERLDPEQLKFVISNTLQVFTNQIKKCGGTVEKYVGDAIMALFGRAEAHEDDSRRAVSAARAILERLEDINSILAQKNIAINARIGVNRGLVVTGHMGEYDTVTGEAINIAQRLEANAPANGILISAQVFDDCQQYYRCEPLPLLYVKNKTEPLTVYLVQDEIAQHVAQSHGSASGTFVGREGEVATLRSAWEHARQGRMRLVQMVAEAGMGKRALINALLQSVRADQHTVRPVWVTADSFGMAPFHLLTDLVRTYMTVANTSLAEMSVIEGDRLEESLGPYQLYIDDLTGMLTQEEDRARLETMEPRARQVETVLAVKRFLAAAAVLEQERAAGPLVVILDNVQWSTTASRDAVAQMLRTMSHDLPILWILAARSADALAWVPSAIPSTVLTLGPLPADAVAAILRQRFPERYLSNDFCRRIFERTGGNPFFLDEVSAVLHDCESLTAFVLEERLPSSIKALVLSKLDRLSRQHKFALQVGAIAGREFCAPLLQHILTRVQYAYSARTVLHELTEAKLIRAQDRTVAFVQPMMAEVAYSTILYANRRKLHGLVAQWMEEQDPAAADRQAAYLADQWERAEEYGKAARYCLTAGHAARARYAHRDAAAFYERALRLHRQAPDTFSPEQLCEVYLHVIEMMEDLGDRDKLMPNIRDGLACAHEMPAQYWKIRLRDIVAENRFGSRHNALTMLDEYIVAPFVCATPELELKGLLLQTEFAHERGGDDAPFIARAQALRTHIDNPPLQKRLDETIFNHYKNADELQKAETYFQRVFAASATNDYARHTSDLHFCSYMWDRGLDFDGIRERALLARDYFIEVGWLRGVGWGVFFAGAALWRLGRFSEASRVFMDGLKIMERAKDNYMIERLELVLAAVFLFQSDTVGYHVRKRRILERAAVLPQPEQLALQREFAMFEGQVLVDHHELVTIHETLLATSSAPLAKVEADEFAITTALVAVQLGKIELAQTAALQVHQHVHDNGKRWHAGLLARVEGIIASARGDTQHMQHCFRESVEHFAAVGARFDRHLSCQAWWHAVTVHGLQTSGEAALVQQSLQEWHDL